MPTIIPSVVNRERSMATALVPSHHLPSILCGTFTCCAPTLTCSALPTFTLWSGG